MSTRLPSRMSMEGKTCIVTGGARGLGWNIASSLADAGARVVISGRDREALDDASRMLASSGADVLPFCCDIRDEQAIASLVAAAIDRFGGIDVLVNNSGVAGPTASVAESEVQPWRDTVETNLIGTFLCCRAVLPAMIEQRTGGSIVNIGTMTAKRPLLGRTSYAASKSALIGFTRTLAFEVGTHGIRVNLVSPGPLEGERIRRVFQAQADSRGISVAQAREEMVSDSPLARLTPPADVAAAVAFLASEAAGSITGEDLNVSAGIVMH